MLERRRVEGAVEEGDVCEGGVVEEQRRRALRQRVAAQQPQPLLDRRDLRLVLCREPEQRVARAVDELEVEQ